MSRSKWKGPYIDTNSLKNLQNLEKAYIRTIITRDSMIVPRFLEKTFEIYNGEKFVEVLVTEEMIGHKFGEFASTRKRFEFKKKKQKNK